MAELIGHEFLWTVPLALWLKSLVNGKRKQLGSDLRKIRWIWKAGDLVDHCCKLGHDIIGLIVIQVYLTAFLLLTFEEVHALFPMDRSCFHWQAQWLVLVRYGRSHMPILGLLNPRRIHCSQKAAV